MIWKVLERNFRTVTQASPSHRRARSQKAEDLGSLLNGPLAANQITTDLLEWEETVETVVMGGDDER